MEILPRIIVLAHATVQQLTVEDDDVEEFLLSSCKKVFYRMAVIDQGLRGKGFPDRVQRRPIDDNCNRMKEFIEKHIRAEIEMWKPATNNAQSATKLRLFELEPSFTASA